MSDIYGSWQVQTRTTFPFGRRIKNAGNVKTQMCCRRCFFFICMCFGTFLFLYVHRFWHCSAFLLMEMFWAVVMCVTPVPNTLLNAPEAVHEHHLCSLSFLHSPWNEALCYFPCTRCIICSTGRCSNHCECEQMWECCREERILVVQTVPQASCCVWPPCSDLYTMREPLLLADT